jgi:Lambda phage tail tube protein, TTP
MPGTSLIAPAIAVEGLLIQLGNGASPEVYATIANATDLTLPLTAETADVTNVTNTWRARIATLKDMGKISFKIFWVMTEPTHMNAITSGVSGIRYLFYNSILGNWRTVYPDGNQSADIFPAYVTGFSITGKVAGVFEATIELSNSAAPTLV